MDRSVIHTDMLNKHPRLADLLLTLKPVAQCAAALAIVFANVLLEWSFFVNSEALGGLAVLFILTHFGILIAIGAIVLKNKEKRDFRSTVGDEIYFDTYPKERAREEKRRAKRNKNSGNP